MGDTPPLALAAPAGVGLGQGVFVSKHSKAIQKRRIHPMSIIATTNETSNVTVLFELPELSLNPLSIRVVNAVIQRIQASASLLGHYEAFFYPLDKIAHWNRGYGRRGFTQYQLVIPFENGLREMGKILTAILSSGELPFLNVLKRLGKESGGVLSFPREGYTFAIDFPIRENIPALLRRLDAMVIDAGGRIYLGKDSYTDAATFRTMYPR
jgi:decaprenylphospho-beta-D-ribofuranose 2-oxidase